MLFNSLKFLIFFPLVVLGYFLIPDRWKHYWLLLASYYFYMSWNAGYALLILFFSYDRLIGYLLSKFEILGSISKSLPSVYAIFASLLPVGLVLGIGIGLIGSLITVRRHLDV